MTNQDESISKLGQFIYRFQFVERQLDDLIILAAKSDDEMIRILITELDFSKKVKALDVMFARFNELRGGLEIQQSNFHALMNKVIKLAERRNELVHSDYWSWLNAEGKVGLLRKKSKLRSKSGKRDYAEEELLPEQFKEDLSQIGKVSQELEVFRLSSIDLLYPE